MMKVLIQLFSAGPLPSNDDCDVFRVGSLLHNLHPSTQVPTQRSPSRPVKTQANSTKSHLFTKLEKQEIRCLDSGHSSCSVWLLCTLLSSSSVRQEYST